MQAVNSVLNQSYTHLEVLIVDDQSKDNTREVVNELASTDARVKYLYNPNKGANNARNYGIQQAKGSLIALLDDDDEWIDTKLEKQYAALLKQPDAGMVFSAFARTKSDGKSFRRHPSLFSIIDPKRITDRLLKHNFITTSAILVRKSVFDKVGYFDPTFKSFQDWELITRIALSFPLIYLNEVMVYQYESSDSITKNKKGRIISSIRHLKKFFAAYAERPAVLADRYSKLGVSLMKQKKYTFAKILFLKSLKIRYWNLNPLTGLLILNIKKLV